MRIVLIGQAAFAEQTLNRLLERSENIIAVYAPPDGSGGRMDPLKKAAIEKGIDVLQPDSYKDNAVFSDYQALKPDLTVMAFVTAIIPSRFFEVPTHGTINYHPSLLPRHRGASAINWAIIMGDTQTGLSIFWPDEGIDTGSILLQKQIDIGPDDTTGSIYFDRLFPLGVEAILESIDLIKSGKAPKLSQDEAQATYEPPCDDRVAGIDWQKSAREIYNHIRGCDPQPGAYTMVKDEQIRFYGAKLIEEPVGHVPGTIITLDDRGIGVAVKGARLILNKIRTKKDGKIPAAEFAANRKLNMGDNFNSGVHP